VTVLHVVPGDLMRGAQVVARNLRERLDREHDEHQIVTLFAGQPAVLGNAQRLDVRPGRARRAGFDPRAAVALRRAVRRLAPRAIVAHGSEPLKYAVAAAGSTPIVYYRFGVATPAANRGWRRRFHRALVSRAALVVAISDDVRDEVVDLLGVEPDRVVMVPNGRDPEIYFPAAERVAPAAPHLIFVGHLTRTKRPFAFLDLVSELRRRGTAVTASIVGDGPLLADVVKAAPADVEVLGARVDVPDLLRTADVFVFSSVPESEGFPGVLIEAAMTGLPIVTTRVPGTMQAVVDGVTGIVVAPDDLAGLCDAVDQLVRDVDRRVSMGAAGRRHAVSGFALGDVVERWREVLAGVAAGRDGS
jgi:glycosyltransferase involved in cell wall biosynthesis